MDEFELIARFFAPLAGAREDVERGIGDDAAILVAGRERLAVTVDTLVEGVHFPAGFDAGSVGYRAAAVNLSDLAAMGATPRWATLALTLPVADASWLAAFADGLGEALTAAGCALVGGDTTRGPLSVTLQLIGALAGPGLRRDAARAGDLVIVSGTLGDAAAGLELLGTTGGAGHEAFLRERYARPTPRLALAQALLPVVRAAIDVSDGLLADLGHVARASEVGVVIEREALPLSPALLAHCGRERALEFAAVGGDDYELAMTCAPEHLAGAEHAAAALGLGVSVVGEVVVGSSVVLRDAAGQVLEPGPRGYRHFT